MESKPKNISKQSKEGLQKFTKSEEPPLFNLSNFPTIEEIRKMSREETQRLGNWIKTGLNKALNPKEEGVKYGEVDKYWDLFEQYITATLPPEEIEGTRRTRWQSNRHTIEREIHIFLTRENRLPTLNDLEYRTGLSRQTITKHLKDGAGAEGYKEELETHRLMTSKVLSKLYRLGMEQNNTKALKIYLDYLTPPPVTKIRQQNNYLQINNTRIDELILEELPKDAKTEIEEILKRNIKPITYKI